MHPDTEAVAGQNRNVSRANLDIHRQHTDKHQHRPEQCVEEKFKRRIDTPRTTPHADDDEHRDQHCLEEQIEHQHVERGEHANHHCLKHQEGDHIFADPHLDRPPARQNRQRRQEGGQQHKGHRDTVNTHVIADTGSRQPFGLFLELIAGHLGIKPDQQGQRDKKGKSRYPEAHMPCILRDNLVLTTDHQQE